LDDKLYTILTNKETYGKKVAIIAMIRGTGTDKISSVLL
jgi:hypothetical protein